MMPGRPSTPDALARIRRDAWNRACKHSTLNQEEIAEVIGKSLATVRSYSTPKGNVPTDEAIAALKRDNLLRAMDTLVERYGNDSVNFAGPRP